MAAAIIRAFDLQRMMPFRVAAMLTSRHYAIRRLASCVALIGYLYILAGNCAWAQCQANETAKLTAFDAAAKDSFGVSVSISGDVAVIGSFDDDPSGSAYVFRFNGYELVREQKLTASDAAAHDLLGHSVSVSGQVVLVGNWAADNACPGDPSCGNSGAAYVFRFDPKTARWIEEAKLTAADAAAADSFGWSVSASGDVAVVGSPADDHSGLDHAGSAYVYRFDGTSWIEEAKLISSDAALTDVFGISVSISGDVALIGAMRDDDDGEDSGAAYVYRFDGSNWIEEAKLTASDAATGDLFGSRVNISGNLAAIGALNDDVACPGDVFCNSGSTYVYRFDGTNWTEEAKLTASDGAAGDRFGISVAIEGDVALIGAGHDDDDDAGANSGSAYVYRFDGSNWIEEAKLTASDASVHDFFGSSLSISGDVAMIGAYKDDDACPRDRFCDSGSAYAFRGLSDCNNAAMLDICDIANGTSQDVNRNGIPDECECIWDLDGSGGVGLPDLCVLLTAWRTNPGGPPDFDGDGVVAVPDLLALLANWGPCP